MSILDYRICLSDRTSKSILASGFNLDGSEMSPQQQQEYEQFKKDNNMSFAPFRSNDMAMGMSISYVKPLSETLGITFNNLPQNSPMRTDTRIVPEEYGLEPRNYDLSEEMVSGKTRDGILSKFNPMNALNFLANIYTGGGVQQALTTSGVGKLFSSILESGRNTPNYQYRTPGYEGRLIASDFYDPKTGLNRFDRAKTLFGQSRTMKDFLDALKEQRDRRAANRAAVQRAIQNQQDAGGSVQSSDSYSGVGDVGATGANFSGDFATDSASYDL